MLWQRWRGSEGTNVNRLSSLWPTWDANMRATRKGVAEKMLTWGSRLKKEIFHRQVVKSYWSQHRKIWTITSLKTGTAQKWNNIYKTKQAKMCIFTSDKDIPGHVRLTTRTLQYLIIPLLSLALLVVGRVFVIAQWLWLKATRCSSLSIINLLNPDHHVSDNDDHLQESSTSTTAAANLFYLSGTL